MDREKVVAWLADEELYYRDRGDTHNSLMACYALALLKEQETVEHALEVLRKAGWKETQNVPFPTELLKEQEAVEPTLIREGRNKHYNDYVCPQCDNEVVYEQNFCSECGIPFLWEGR